MGLLHNLIPINLLEEREKFFADQSYNPQFRYVRNFSRQKLVENGLVKPQLFNFCLGKIKEFGIPSTRSISKAIKLERANEMVFDSLKKYGLETEYNVVFDEKATSGCLLVSNRLLFRLPLRYSEARFANLLRHEVETHILRRKNDRIQPWHTRARTPEVVKTEEGLAILNSYLFHRTKRLRSSFVAYATVGWAQKSSFVEVYNLLLSLGADRVKAWKLTVNVKRGLEDTSLPGGFTKTIIYLEGIIRVSQWVLTTGNDPRDLYLGSVSLDEIAERKRQAYYDGLKIPEFMVSKEDYVKRVEEIVSVNSLRSIWNQV